MPPSLVSHHVAFYVPFPAADVGNGFRARQHGPALARSLFVLRQTTEQGVEYQSQGSIHRLPAGQLQLGK